MIYKIELINGNIIDIVCDLSKDELLNQLPKSIYTGYRLNKPIHGSNTVSIRTDSIIAVY